MAAVSEVIGQASSEPVIQAGARRIAGAYPFLLPNHPLLQNTDAKLIDEKLSSEVNATDHALFADFLSVASSHHLFEGWCFLSKTAYALASGKANAAIHLGYYAELRAARSLLACGGIHIGNNKHFLLKKTGEVVLLDRELPEQEKEVSLIDTVKYRFMNAVDSLRGNLAPQKQQRQFGTHVATWAVLKHWTQSREIVRDFANRMPALTYGGIDWVRACNSTQHGSEVVADWLSDWCFDLKQLSNDSILRNSASYGVHLGPNAFPVFDGTFVDIVLKAATASIEFDNDNNDQFDLILLSDFCFKTFRMLSRTSQELNRIKERRDQRMFNRLRRHLVNVAGIPMADATDLLRRVRDATLLPGFSVITSAANNQRNATGVFSRAFLLLRLANSMHRWYWEQVRQLLPTAQTWQADLINMQALHANLATAPGMIATYFDLAEDTRDAITEIETWRTGRHFTGHDLWSEMRSEICELCRLERVAIWSSSP
jgi:hypothetical protein